MEKRLSIFGVIIVVTAMFIGIWGYTGPQVLLNDFWGLLLIARKSPDLASLSNGYFPVGYLLFLKAILWTKNNLLLTAVVFQVGALVAYFVFIYKRLEHHSFLLVIIGTLSFLVVPTLFDCQFTLGPYAYFQLLVSAAIILIAFPVQGKINYTWVGILLGLACLFRYQGLAFVPIIMLYILVFDKKRKVGFLYFLLGFGLALLPQVTLLLTDTSSFNLELIFQGDTVDWSNHAPRSQSNNVNFWGALDSLFENILIRWKLGLVLLILISPVKHRKVGFVLVGYFLIASLSSSPRAVWCIMPVGVILIVDLFLSIRILTSERKSNLSLMKVMLSLVVSGIGFFFLGSYDRLGTVLNHSEQQAIFQKSLDSFDDVSIQECYSVCRLPWVYSKRYPFRPHTSGGWPAGIPWLYENYKKALAVTNINTGNSLKTIRYHITRGTNGKVEFMIRGEKEEEN